ncbi:hypothetical protein PAMP_022321 [Pampus punctatissimus]
MGSRSSVATQEGNSELFPASSTAPPCRMEQHMSVVLAQDQSRRQATSACDSPFAYNSLSSLCMAVEHSVLTVQRTVHHLSSLSTYTATETEPAETEISTRRKECEALEAEVKKKNQTCLSKMKCTAPAHKAESDHVWTKHTAASALLSNIGVTQENEIQDFLQGNKHLSLQLFSNSHEASEYEKVKSEYAQLKETLGAVTQERDLALRERNQLQGKLENLEQVLKCRVGRSDQEL